MVQKEYRERWFINFVINHVEELSESYIQEYEWKVSDVLEVAETATEKQSGSDYVILSLRMKDLRHPIEVLKDNVDSGNTLLVQISEKKLCKLEQYDYII